MHPDATPFRCHRCGTLYAASEVGTTDKRLCYACDPDEGAARDEALRVHLLVRRAADRGYVIVVHSYFLDGRASRFVGHRLYRLAARDPETGAYAIGLFPGSNDPTTLDQARAKLCALVENPDV